MNVFPGNYALLWIIVTDTRCNCCLLYTSRGENFEVLCETIKKTAFKVTRVGQLVAQEASRRLSIPFGIIDLSLAPTPAIGDSVADILCEIGLEYRCV